MATRLRAIPRCASKNYFMKSPRLSDTTNSASTKEKRLHLERLVSAAAPTPAEINAGSDAVSGLTQNPKSLPPKYFYDDRGSNLFELICQLPEYYLTRTETAILQGCAGAIARPARAVKRSPRASTRPSSATWGRSSPRRTTSWTRTPCATSRRRTDATSSG